jgi:acyl-CoA reductase-like NAD-dependent aldehyde dehydrogenase
MRKYLNFINGWRSSSETDGKMQTRNPADTREVVAEYAVASKEDVMEAVQAAQKSFAAWSAMTPVARGRILSKTSQILESRKAELSELFTR